MAHHVTETGSASQQSAIGTRALGGYALMFAAYSSFAWLGASPPVNGVAFVAAFAAAWTGYALLFAIDRRSVLWLSICLALAARVAGLFTPPIYEDDWARYLWDGYRFLQDGTPYLAAPRTYANDAGLSNEWLSILGTVNNPDVPTIYAPALQYVFAFTSWIGPANLTVLKGTLVAFDLALWAIIWRLAGARAGLRYALCPLVVFEVSFNAHADIIGAALAVASYALVRGRHTLAGGVAFGLSLACKPFALILAPAILGRGWAVVSLSAGIVLLGLYLPFIVNGATEYAGLEVFSRWWEFNSLGFAALKAVLGDAIARPVSLALGATLAAISVLRWRLREPETLPPADHWLLALLLFAPVINPWYLLWAVPWACLRPNALTWSILPAVSISYLTAGVLGLDTSQSFDHPLWVRPLEIVAALAIYLSLRTWSRRRLRMQNPYAAAGNIEKCELHIENGWLRSRTST